MASKFQTIVAGALTMTADRVQVEESKPLILGRDASDNLMEAVTLGQLNAVKDAVNLIAGDEAALDTLQEMKQFVIDVSNNGAADLLAAITAEVSDRQSADQALSDSIASEVSDRQSADQALSDSIASEASARQTADQELSDAIASEASARQTADQALSDAIASEASARQTADDALLVSIDNEASARQTADDALSVSIDNEASARQSADQELSDLLFKHNIMPLSPLVFADMSPPIPMPVTIRNQTFLDGWYFKNGGAGTATEKINWYLPAPSDTSGSANLGSLIEINMPVRVVNATSVPFITIYTKPTGNGDEALWYHTRYTYVASVAAEGYYLFRVRIAGGDAVGSHSNFTQVDLSYNSQNSSDMSTFDPADEIFGIAIGTNSAAAAGNVECVIHKLNIFSNNGNYSNLFSNAAPLNKYLKENLDSVFISLGQPTLADV